jgi:ATP-dependent Clp endopeptidase proteolytic subunit ClpP
MKNWYSIKNRASGVLDISLHDEVGMWGISAQEFLNDLSANSDANVINLSIHSPGGSVLDGLAIYNSLKSHPAKVYGHVEGIAASAASFILMAADVITMPEDAFIMIHNAHGGAIGDADYLREVAEVIDKMQSTVVNIYERRTGLDRDEIEAMMKVETWMSASEALEKGFTDNITDALGVAAKATGFAKHFKSMPVAEIDIDEIKTITDFEKRLRDAGVSKGLAQAMTSRAKVIFRGEPDEDDSALSKISAALEKARIPTQLNALDAD